MFSFIWESIVSLTVWGVVGYFFNPYIRQVMSFVPAPQEKKRLVNAATYSFILTALVGCAFYIVGAGGYGVLDFAFVWLLTGFLEYATHRNTNGKSQ